MSVSQKQELYYGDYLQLPKLLGLQNPLSIKTGEIAQHEMFFIILHQTFELWFKEILLELDTVRFYLNLDVLDDQDITTVIARLMRVVAVFQLLLQQLTLLETLKPIDFLEFRDLLTPSSGFQSVQFRQLELALGVPIDKKAFDFQLAHLKELDQALLQKARSMPSLFTLINNWLERMPCLRETEYDFLGEYKKALAEYLKPQQEMVEQDHISSQQKEIRIAQIEALQSHFQTLFDAQNYREYAEKHNYRMSYQAFVHALFIQVYEDQPLLQMPYQLLTLALKIDELFTEWRFQHVLMVHRMIGDKAGTGGALGYAYLRGTIDRSRVFAELGHMATYLLPLQWRPALSQRLKTNLGFRHVSEEIDPE